jgi:hypothetical protein
MSFENDIKGQNTQLYPIVVIERGEESDGLTMTPDYIFLSTNNVNIDLVSSDSGLISNPTVHCKPLLLNIPSIKESVDVESRKFKISNVSLDISNYEYEGKRFTDILSETSLINTPVSIYFKSPSTTWVSSREDIADNFKYNLCPLVFKGVVRRLSHDDEKVKVELEDLTEKKAHKDLPQAIDQNGVAGYLGDGHSIPDKYKNKPIPIVYGHVDKSPVVISENFRKYQADSKVINGFIEFYSGYDKASGAGIWLDSLQVDIDGEVFHIQRGSQYEYGDNSIGLLASVLSSDDPSIIEETSLTCRRIAAPKFTISNTKHDDTLINEYFLDPEFTIDNINAITDGSLDINNIALNGERNIYTTSGEYSGQEGLLLSLNFDVTPQHDTLDGNNKIIGLKINGYNLPQYLGIK